MSAKKAKGSLSVSTEKKPEVISLDLESEESKEIKNLFKALQNSKARYWELDVQHKSALVEQNNVIAQLQKGLIDAVAVAGAKKGIDLQDSTKGKWNFDPEEMTFKSMG